MPDLAERLPDLPGRLPDLSGHLPDLTGRLPDLSELSDRLPDLPDLPDLAGLSEHLPVRFRRAPVRTGPNRLVVALGVAAALAVLAVVVATILGRRGAAADAPGGTASDDAGYAPSPLTADVDAVTAADLRPVHSTS
jgi:hypothetical protein